MTILEELRVGVKKEARIVRNLTDVDVQGRRDRRKKLVLGNMTDRFGTPMPMVPEKWVELDRLLDLVDDHEDLRLQHDQVSEQIRKNYAGRFQRVWGQQAKTGAVPDPKIDPDEKDLDKIDDLLVKRWAIEQTIDQVCIKFGERDAAVVLRGCGIALMVKRPMSSEDRRRKTVKMV